MGFLLVPKSVTLNDTERRNNHSQVAAVHPFELSWVIIISEIISQCATWVLLCDNGVMFFFTDKLFLSKCVFYVVLFKLMVKTNYRNIFCDDYWSISVI